MSAHIVIHRYRAMWRDIARGYKIDLNGQVVGKIRNGNTVALAVQPGLHRARLRIDWSGSPTVDVMVADGATVHLEVRPAGTILGIYWRLFTRTKWLDLYALAQIPPQDADGFFAD